MKTFKNQKIKRIKIRKTSELSKLSSKKMKILKEMHHRVVDNIKTNIRRVQKNQVKDHIVAQITATKAIRMRGKEAGAKTCWRKK